ncbi:MAG: glutamate racemase [Candidatus Latescibacterota bacterium]|nr:MAG: glutamate racemase [Candidatus Latescibacterota bacterium]
MTKDGAIGVFDSGIGGLTVLKELLTRLPGESFVYFGDTARVPYGTKSVETVLRFSRENVTFLLDQSVKFIVVACNTASASAVPRLQREFRIPILGVIEPGVRAAVERSRTSKIGVIGTAGTIRSGAYQNGIKQLDPQAEVMAKPCPLFVPLAEEGWVDTPVTELAARTYFDGFLDDGIDVLVLGCTHYPLLAGVIGRVVGDGVALVDSAVETASEVRRALERDDLLSEGAPGDFTIYLSDIAPDFQQVGERILERPIPDVRLRPV